MMRVNHVSAKYKTITGDVLALKDVDFEIRDNEIFGIAGESGCGKSTLLKVLYDIMNFPLELAEGSVELEYMDSGERKRLVTDREHPSGIRGAWWNAISYVPQAAQSVLNPVYRIEDQFYELFRRHRRSEGRKAMYERVNRYLDEVGLPRDVLKSYPHQLSGGMRQRVVIAMATFLHPSMIFADEPTTALDVVVQKGILQMLMELQAKMGNSLVIVSHDMGVHYQITNRMAIMYSGSMVELGPTDDIFASPLHPYTQMLIRSLPKIGDQGMRVGIQGGPPDLRNPPPGCRFAPRCKMAKPECSQSAPKFTEVQPGRFAACHLLNR